MVSQGLVLSVFVGSVFPEIQKYSFQARFLLSFSFSFAVLL